MNKDSPEKTGVSSLRQKVLTPFFVILIALGATATIGSQYAINDSLTKTADERLEAFQQQIYREIRNLEADLEYKAKLLELSYIVDHSRAIPDNEISRIERLIEETLVAKNMRATFIDPQALDQFPNPGLEQMFSQARASGKSRIRFTTSIGPTPSLSLVTPIIQKDTVSQYILLQSSIDQSYLEEISQPLKIKISILDLDGQTLVRSHQNGPPHTLNEELLQRVLSGEQVFMTDDKLLSNRALYSVVPLGTTDLLLLAIELPLTDVNNLLTVFFTRSAFLVTAALLIGGYIYFRLVSRIIRPTEDMLAATRAIADGNLDYRLQEDNAGEFEQLAVSFNHMMGRLSTVYDDRIRQERELAIAQEQLKFKSLLEDKNREIEAANKELGEQNRELSVLLQINRDMSTTLDLNTLFDKVLSALNDLLECNIMVLLTYDPGAEKLETSHALGIDKDALSDISFKLSEGISGETARTRTTTYVPDLKTDKRYLSYKKAMTVFGSMLSIPLVTHSRLCGVLNLHKDKIDGFDTAEITLSQAVASQAAIAIENAQLYRQAKELSVKDELTGLSNRRHFQDILLRETVQTQRYSTSLSLIMADIDYFKKYNDFHGHLQGDVVLKKVANCLLQNTRGIDLVCRFGGEEFIILLPKTDTAGAVIAAEKLRRVIEDESFSGEEESQPGGRLTLSLGVAAFPEDSSDIQALMELADQALYKAKQQGRNRVVAFTGSKQKA